MSNATYYKLAASIVLTALSVAFQMRLHDLIQIYNSLWEHNIGMSGPRPELMTGGGITLLIIFALSVYIPVIAFVAIWYKPKVRS